MKHKFTTSIEENTLELARSGAFASRVTLSEFTQLALDLLIAYMEDQLNGGESFTTEGVKLKVGRPLGRSSSKHKWVI